MRQTLWFDRLFRQIRTRHWAGDRTNPENKKIMSARNPSTPLSKNPGLIEWVNKMAALLKPANIHWVDGSQEENDALCSKLVPHRTGEVKPVRALILGIPNVGKSTLMNHLARRKIANVADTPGVTKSQQRIELQNGMILYDTPGLLWPKVHDENSGYRLAMAGSIGTNAYDQVDVAWFAIETLRERYPQALLDRYGLKGYVDDVEAMFAMIAKRRGAVLSGGRIDEQKAAELILTDFRSGALGRITLETPDDITEPPVDGEPEADVAEGGQ